MSRWQCARLDQLCEVTSSKRIYATELCEAGVPFYRSKEILDKLAGKGTHSNPLFISEERFQEILRQTGAPIQGDLLLTSRGTLGAPYIVTKSDRFHFADGNLTWFRHFKGLDSRYLKYYLLSPDGKAELMRCVIGSSQLAYTIAAIKKIILPLPPLPTQRRIAGILSAYDELIENNQRRIKILEEMARSLYREWFVHFRFPGHDKVKMVPSTLGPVPQGWKVTKLGSLVEINKGKNITKKTIRPGDVPVVAGGVTPAYFHDTPNTSRPVITISASGANAGFVNLYHADVWASDCSYVDSSATPHIYYYYLWLDHRRSEVTHLQRGSAQPHVYSKDLAQLQAIGVPEQVLNIFTGQVTPIFELMMCLTERIENLRRTRDLLLPRLLSGQVNLEVGNG